MNEGLFGPDSVAWRLHADSTMLIAAMRALLVQALEPRAMAGVAQHSDYQTDPWKRLDRTVRFILATPSMTGQMIALDGGQHLA